jgi:oleate hydratase
MMGGNLDGVGNHAGGYSLRGRRMLTTDNYKYTGDRYKSILLLHNKSTMVFDETVEFSVTPCSRRSCDVELTFSASP